MGLYVVVRAQRRLLDLAAVAAAVAGQEAETLGLEQRKYKERGAGALEKVARAGSQSGQLPPDARRAVRVGHQTRRGTGRDALRLGAERVALAVTTFLVAGAAHRLPRLHEPGEEPAQRAAPDVRARSRLGIGPDSLARPVVAVKVEPRRGVVAVGGEEAHLQRHVRVVGRRRRRRRGRRPGCVSAAPARALMAS